MSNHRVRRRAVVVLVLGALVVGGCGGDQDGEAGATGTATSAGQTPDEVREDCFERARQLDFRRARRMGYAACRESAAGATTGSGRSGDGD